MPLVVFLCPELLVVGLVVSGLVVFASLPQEAVRGLLLDAVAILLVPVRAGR